MEVNITMGRQARSAQPAGSVRRQLLLGLAGGLAALAAPAVSGANGGRDGKRSGACLPWTDWEAFRRHFISDSGRVVDPSIGGGVTTSEGQSYALFYALVANDPATFAKLLRWTEENLAGGDLTARLPAWQWGKKQDGSWGVLDDNPASDSDLWIAYCLGEAARLWKAPKYAALAALLAARIMREETVQLKGLGRALLPGPRGFTPQAGVARLNPSYVPLSLMRRMAALYPDSGWKGMPSVALDMVQRSAPRGFAPEWVLYKEEGGFQPDPETKADGSHNAIRVYLWAGMLDADDPARPVLLKTFAPMARHLEKTGVPPLNVDTRQGVASGIGPVGFSASLLPFLAASKLDAALRQQRLRLEAKPPRERSDNYYEQALALFGLGFVDGRFRFGRDGALQPRWPCAGG